MRRWTWAPNFFNIDSSVWLRSISQTYVFCYSYVGGYCSLIQQECRRTVGEVKKHLELAWPRVHKYVCIIRQNTFKIKNWHYLQRGYWEENISTYTVIVFIYICQQWIKIALVIRLALITIRWSKIGNSNIAYIFKL